LKAAFKRLTVGFDRLDAVIDKRIQLAVKEAGLTADVARCQAIEGIGPLTAVALVMSFLRGNFRSSDAFIAFIGMDVRVRDSGKQRGQRKLSKRGNSEVRRLLFTAAMAASRSPTWAPTYQGYRKRGLTAIEGFVILGRKLARIAFALMKNQTTYEPARKNACIPT
jgi:transposase